MSKEEKQPTDLDLLSNLSERLLSSLVNRVPRATGGTADARRAEVTESSLQVFMPLHFMALVEGRGPTQATSPSSPTLKQQILEWLNAKGITPRPNVKFSSPRGRKGSASSPTKDTLAFLIARKIHRYGFKGRPSILEGWFTDGDMASLMEQVAKSRAAAILSDIKELLSEAA